MQDLTTALQAALDNGMADALVSASQQDGELVLVVTSPAWASRLRYETDTLLRAARAHGVKATRASVRVSSQA